MAYLPRSERRTEVLEAVVRISAEHGFDGATVRRVAAELAISAGNIHHLFGSAAQLKREAFRHFAETEIAALDAAAEQPSAIGQLHAYLSGVAVGTDPRARRIWTAAGQEAARDAEFAEIWAEEAEVWLHRITDLLVALTDGVATIPDATEAAWRLMSYSIGVNSFVGSERLGISRRQIDQHITKLVAYEIADLNEPAPAMMEEGADAERTSS